jgi:hypothetical protein
VRRPFPYRIPGSAVRFRIAAPPNGKNVSDTWRKALPFLRRTNGNTFLRKA